MYGASIQPHFRALRTDRAGLRLCIPCAHWLPLACCRHFVDFHGEMLLLVHWSILAYTGLVKILKKHHKRTGLLVRAPHLDNLLNQPFCSVEVRAQPRRPVGWICRHLTGGVAVGHVALLTRYPALQLGFLFISAKLCLGGGVFARL